MPPKKNKEQTPNNIVLFHTSYGTPFRPLNIDKRLKLVEVVFFEGDEKKERKTTIVFYAIREGIEAVEKHLEERNNLTKISNDDRLAI